MLNVARQNILSKPFDLKSREVMFSFKVLFLSLLLHVVANADDPSGNVFNEELVLKELGDGFISSYFQFTTRSYFENPDDRKII